MIEKMIFNSDVVNNNDHIFFPSGNNKFFEVCCFPLYDNVSLMDSIREALRAMHEECLSPKIVFIPLVRYNYAMIDEMENDVLSDLTLQSFCEYHDLQYLVMTPDCLKDKVKVPQL